MKTKKRIEKFCIDIKNDYLCTRFRIAKMQNPDVQNVMNSLGIFGRSPLLMQALNAAIQAAPFDVSVLVTGENGVGKEVFHRILHNYSPRKHSKCIAVNCGGLPEGTIDSELFGHVKGAFTGATTDRKGYFEEADGGTIFLDEIGELPAITQARLLRVLETGEYYRMGSSEVRRTNVRVVAATNVDLRQAIREHKFREDLFYRLSTITINVPSLRDRQEDIDLLFRKFANDISGKYRMPKIELTEDARHLLLAYQWPGNVRQLLHTVEEISIVEQERVITPQILQRHLPQFVSGVSVGGAASDGSSTFGPGEKEMLYKVIFEMRQQLIEVREKLGMNTASGMSHPAHHLIASESSSVSSKPGSIHVEKSPSSLSESLEDIEEALEVETTAYTPSATVTSASSSTVIRTMEEIEKEAIQQALERNNGNKRKAADELQISERTIHRKIQDYGL